MTAPTPEFRRHHDVEPPRVDGKTFRQGWRVRTRLDGLLADRKITPAVWRSAIEYRDACDAMRKTGSTIAPGHRGNGNGHGGGLIHALHQTGRVRAVEAAMGLYGTYLCRSCVVEDRPWYVTGHRLGVRNVTAMSWTVRALVTLAALWPLSEQR